MTKSDAVITLSAGGSAAHTICHTKLLLWHVEPVASQTRWNEPVRAATERITAQLWQLTLSVLACVFSLSDTSVKHALSLRLRDWCWHAAGAAESGPAAVHFFFQYVPCLVSGIHSSLSLGLWDFFDIKIDTRGRTQRAPLFLRERRACALLILRSKPTSGTALHIQALIKERICAWMTSSKVPGGCGKGPFSGRGLALAVPASENGLMDQDKSSSEKGDGGDGGGRGVDCRSDCKELWWVR